MNAPTRFFLLAGCACVLTLQGPRTIAVLATGLSGPYPVVRAEAPPPAQAAPRTAAAPRHIGASVVLVWAGLGVPVGLMDLPRR